MTHALAAFIQGQADDRGWRNRDLVRESGLSKQVISTYLNDKRERLSRLPEKSTVEGFAKAFNVPPDFILGKAIESLGLGYSSGDFINSVDTATDQQLLDAIAERLRERSPSQDVTGSDLPNISEAREARRQRLIQAGQPQTKASYDDPGGPGKSPDDTEKK